MMTESEQCLFCRLQRGEINARILYQDDVIMAFVDIQPAAPFHALIIPRRHIVSVADTTAADEPLIGCLFGVARRLAKEQQLATGYRLVINNGVDAGQTVFHLHLHLLAGRTMQWPPG